MSKLAWPIIEEEWHECAIRFVCPCGEEIYVDDQEEPYACPCGRTYSVSLSFTYDDEQDEE